MPARRSALIISSRTSVFVVLPTTVTFFGMSLCSHELAAPARWCFFDPSTRESRRFIGTMCALCTGVTLRLSAIVRVCNVFVVA
jgi:hypothetical protein